MKAIHIIGAGMAGSEAAWQIAESGIPVITHEMRPERMTDAHTGGSLPSLYVPIHSGPMTVTRMPSGCCIGRCGRPIRSSCTTADRHQVPAGGALAVDREGFAQRRFDTAQVTSACHREGGRGSSCRRKSGATASLQRVLSRTVPLAEAIQTVTGEGNLAFFDAIAPIVYRDSIDMNVAWFQSRYDKVGPGGTGKDYINCPLDKEQYESFRRALDAGEKSDFREWEKSTPYFSGCLPIEVMAEQGPETLRHGPMKARGLTNAHNPTTQGLCRRATAAGQQAWLALQHRRLPDQAQACRAGSHLPHHSWAGKCRVREAWRPASQHLHQQPQCARRRTQASPSTAHTLCRSDHRRGRIRGKRCHRPTGWADGHGCRAKARSSCHRQRRQHMVHSSTTSRAVMLKRLTRGLPPSSR